MLEALPSLRTSIPDVRWVVVGDGKLLDGLRRRARELGVDDAVDFRGNMSDDERDAVLRSAHAFCMPSRLDRSTASARASASSTSKRALSASRSSPDLFPASWTRFGTA